MNKPLLKKECEYQRLKGEFIGTLKGILYWDIPEELKEIMLKQLKELEDE